MSEGFLSVEIFLSFKVLSESLTVSHCICLYAAVLETHRKGVYEYLSNGNLYDWLHPDEGESSNIDWPLKVKIAIGVARGLILLHKKFGIAHLDISFKCILLDQYFEPKLSNFRRAMHLNQNSDRISQMNYVTDDVYSFGVVLLELITGKEDEEIEYYLSKCSSLPHEDPFPDQRPTMLQVYITLGAIGERYGLVDTSEAMMRNEFATEDISDECIDEEEITELT
ncbi:probably inactive leucine-rich repeat receptor-like protein kinase At5g48380 [Pistacia vera]|uniref:probably inactive leucine-rich repeat receptor-like protein kinase At5g48380 n=1 Tax=Pistacia vera TaxID=55513 RepID=UPI001262B1A2|nr:probably inactive leucine-rich repeat receptor-like protein kinase At5g48380 [Pistacia vera]